MASLQGSLVGGVYWTLTNKAVDVLSGYLAFFAEALPQHWNAGDSAQGYLCTNLGIRALLRVLKEICKHIANKEKLELDMYDSEMVLGYIKSYVGPVIDYFEKATPDNLKSFKDSSKAGVNKSSLNMMGVINGKLNDFCPEDLKNYLDTIDIEGSTVAASQLTEIERRIFEVTISLLKKKHGDRDEKWWWEGIPIKVRENCVKQQNADHGEKAKEQYIYLVDLHAIASSDWDLFKDYYSFSKDNGKAKQLDWLIKLNKIRTTTHHGPKWPATKEQVNFVREYHSKVMERFKLPEEK